MAGFHDCMLSNRYGLLKVKSMLSGQHEVCATSWWPRERAALIWAIAVNAADGCGVAASPSVASAVDGAKPTAPAAMASRTSAVIAAISSSLAVRSVASSPLTEARLAEWPER